MRNNSNSNPNMIQTQTYTINFGEIDLGSSKSCSSEEQLLEVDCKEGLADQVGG